jgi:hypothetical protein
MGDPRPDPILIPPVLTDEELPPVATDYATAASYLQRVADACSLLLQQRRLIKNSPAFAASAAQHALTIVLPMPNADPRFCFWRKEPMRRETQLNLLFLLRRLCRIYSAATACVQQSRGLIAIRSTAFAAAACVADAICRVIAVDDPSAFALHYSGLCEGPTEPFAIEAGAFDTLGSNLPIYDPNICSLRYQCLDYLRGLSLKMDGTPRLSIFNFDTSLAPLEGDTVLIDQLSIQLALQRPHPPTELAMKNHTAGLIGGKNGSLMEVLPEFGYFRDIIFHFKHAVSGKDQTPEVADTHTWVPSDATLHWDVRRNEENKEDPVRMYHVTAFASHPQLFVERIALQEKKSKKNGFLSFLALFSGKSRIERSRLSSADATTVVNSCGEKFLGKRYVAASYARKSIFVSLDLLTFAIRLFCFIQIQARLGGDGRRCVALGDKGTSHLWQYLDTLRCGTFHSVLDGSLHSDPFDLGFFRQWRPHALVGVEDQVLAIDCGRGIVRAWSVETCRFHRLYHRGSCRGYRATRESSGYPSWDALQRNCQITRCSHKLCHQNVGASAGHGCGPVHEKVVVGSAHSLCDSSCCPSRRLPQVCAKEVHSRAAAPARFGIAGQYQSGCGVEEASGDAGCPSHTDFGVLD